MMKLKFVNTYLSIARFDEIELPDFAVLTGVNGSGKSHLLQAIERKDVLIEDIENPHIVRFNHETFKLENEQTFTANQLVDERNRAWSFFFGQ